MVGNKVSSVLNVEGVSEDVYFSGNILVSDRKTL